VKSFTGIFVGVSDPIFGRGIHGVTIEGTEVNAGSKFFRGDENS
jgi:hypothetical protein